MSEYEVERGGGGRGPVWIGLVVVVVCVGLIAGAFLGRGVGGGGGVTPTAPARVRVVASIPPLAWPIRELAPEAEVMVLTGPGASPHGMEITPSQLRAIAEADVVLLVGLGLDEAARRAVSANPSAGRQVVVLEDALEMAGVRRLAHDHAHDHAGHDHAEHAGIHDPHAWLDPAVMRVFVARVDAALARVTGGTATGAPMLQQRCEGIDRMHRIALGALPHRRLVCQHNAYGYLAARYDLEIVAVVQPVESGEVSPGDLKRVVDAIREHRIGAIFIEPGADRAAAERVGKETGARILTLDPLGDGDWPALMSGNLTVLLEGLSARLPARAPEDDADLGTDTGS